MPQALLLCADKGQYDHLIIMIVVMVMMIMMIMVIMVIVMVVIIMMNTKNNNIMMKISKVSMNKVFNTWHRGLFQYH